MRQDVRTFAHDLNGVLAGILAAADVHSQRDGAQKEVFASIVGAARRAGDLTERLVNAATSDESGFDSAYQRDLDYLEKVSGGLDPVLNDLERLGRSNDIPIVDRETGRFLAVLVAAKQAANVVEIGTAYGYSTLWMARALPSQGRIVTIDPDTARTAIAKDFFRRADVSDRIEVRNAKALDVLPGLAREHYDLIFIDALKEEYSEYLQASVPLLKTSGILLADNLLWAHRAAQPPRSSDDAALKAIRRFNEELLGHPALAATILPVGDGVGFATKVAKGVSS